MSLRSTPCGLVGLILFLTLFMGCAPRTTVRTVTDIPSEASVVPVLLGTTRQLDAQNSPGEGRSTKVSFLEYNVSVPPERGSAGISWPGFDALDPNVHFVTESAQKYRDEAAFLQQLRARLNEQPSGQREVLLFIHGYNTNFAEGLYRAAQLTHDFGGRGVTAHFAWPANPRLNTYLKDRDSALFSRDGLEEMIRLIARAKPDRLVVAAHSMGSFLLVETLRQMELKSPGLSDRLIDGVVLIAPDVDVDLFLSQTKNFAALPQPFFIVTSSRDRLLGLSGRLAGRTDRLGRVVDPARLANRAVTLVDISQFSDPSSLGHWTFGNSETLAKLIRNAPRVDGEFRGESIPDAGYGISEKNTALDATQVVLDPGAAR